jgi:hypothetical protein
MVCGPVLEYIDQLHAPLSLCLHLAAEWSHLAGQGAYHGLHLNGWEGEDKGGGGRCSVVECVGGGGGGVLHLYKI